MTPPPDLRSAPRRAVTRLFAAALTLAGGLILATTPGCASPGEGKNAEAKDPEKKPETPDSEKKPETPDADKKPETPEPEDKPETPEPDYPPPT